MPAEVKEQLMGLPRGYTCPIGNRDESRERGLHMMLANSWHCGVVERLFHRLLTRLDVVGLPVGLTLALLGRAGAPDLPRRDR